MYVPQERYARWVIDMAAMILHRNREDTVWRKSSPLLPPQSEREAWCLQYVRTCPCVCARRTSDVAAATGITRWQ